MISTEPSNVYNENQKNHYRPNNVGFNVIEDRIQSVNSSAMIISAAHAYKAEETKPPEVINLDFDRNSQQKTMHQNYCDIFAKSISQDLSDNASHRLQIFSRTSN